jgi:hypothetical protein
LLLLHVLLTLLGLFAAGWLSLRGRTTSRLHSWMAPALVLVAVANLVLLLLQLLLGFPIEQDSGRVVVAYRTLWVGVVVLVNFVMVLTGLLLLRLRRRPNGQPVPRVEVAW